MTVTIQDSCPKFTATFSDGKVITDRDMQYDEMCDYCDSMNISKENMFRQYKDGTIGRLIV